MNACPLVEAGSKENWGRPQMPDLIILGTLFNLYCNSQDMMFVRKSTSQDNATQYIYSRTSIIRPPLGSGPWIGVRIREMFRIRRMSMCAHYMYLISKVVENYDLSCPSRTSTRLHIHHTSNTNITSMMF